VSLREKISRKDRKETQRRLMSITVHLSGHLKPFSGGAVEVNLPGEFATVGDALDSLWREHPALRDRVLNEQHEIRQHVNIFAGSEDVKRRKGLATRLSSDELHIFNAVSGG
jgi:sulfur-carrier protein